MKTRNGFVTNSSSSSFIVAMKEGLTKEKLTEKLQGKFAVDKEHPLFHLVQDVIKQIANEVFYSVDYKFTSIEDVVENWGIEDDDDNELIKLFNKYGNVISASFSSDGDTAEALLCSTTFTFEDEDVYMKNEGGY